MVDELTQESFQTGKTIVTVSVDLITAIADASFGFGQANVWFANGRKENKELDSFLNRIVKQIEEYDGDNWIDMRVDGRRG